MSNASTFRDIAEALRLLALRAGSAGSSVLRTAISEAAGIAVREAGNAEAEAWAQAAERTGVGKQPDPERPDEA